jgi:hypothetical protein
MAMDDARKRTMTELRRAARAAFADLDLRMVGSSPRQWLGDRGWWAVNVEFQASRIANTAMLNVGVQHLWTFFDGRAFDLGGRVPGVVADFTGSDDAVRAAAERIAATLSLIPGVREAVHSRRIPLGTAPRPELRPREHGGRDDLDAHRRQQPNARCVRDHRVHTERGPDEPSSDERETDREAPA